MKVIRPNTLSTTDGTFARASVGSYWNEDKIMQESSANQPRFNYNPDTGVFEGMLIEQSSTNLLLNSETLSTQTVTVVDTSAYTLSFYGTGSVVSTGALIASTTGTGAYKKTSLSFTASGSSVTFTVTGSVKYAQLELGNKSTSWIKTLGTSASRSTDVIIGPGLIINTTSNPDPAWTSGATYPAGAKVTYNKKVYESLQAANTNKQPNTNPTWWLDSGSDNRHACFDGQINTKTSSMGKLWIVIQPGSIDAVALIDMDATIVKLAMFDITAGLVATKVLGLSGLSVFDWYQYFFYDPLLKRTQAIFDNLPVYPNSYITIELQGAPVPEGAPASTVTVAEIVFGLTENLGGTQYGATAGIIDYSVKKTDEFGNISFVRRNYSKRLSAQLFTSNVMLNRVQRFLTSVRALPCVWIGSDDPQLEETLIVYGFYKDFSIDIAYPSHSLCSLEIEGLT